MAASFFAPSNFGTVHIIWNSGLPSFFFFLPSSSHSGAMVQRARSTLALLNKVWPWLLMAFYFINTNVPRERRRDGLQARGAGMLVTFVIFCVASILLWVAIALPGRIIVKPTVFFMDLIPISWTVAGISIAFLYSKTLPLTPRMCI